MLKSKFAKLNILVISDFFYPDFAGGSATVAHELNKYFLKEGHSIDVITRLSNGLSSEEIILGQNIYRLKISIRNFPSAIVNALYFIKRLIKEKQYDCIISHYSLLGLPALFLARKYNIPYIFYFHGPWHKEACFKQTGMESKKKLNYFMRLQVDKFILNNANHIIFLSNYMLNEAQIITNIPVQRYSIIPGGVDLQHFQPIPNREKIRIELGISCEIPAILSVRRLERRMGLSNLIKAVHLLREKGKLVNLLIGGIGSQETKLTEIISLYRLENLVKMLGFIPENKLPSYYAAADLFVLPSVALEGFGLSTLEALSSGTPVIGTDCGATPEILLPLGNDYLLDNAEPETIGDGIERFLLQKENKALRTKMRDYAENFAWEKSYNMLKNTILSYTKIKNF